MRSRSIVATLLAVLSLAAIATAPIRAAGAEVSPNGESTWGVYGLATGTQTDAIDSLVFAIEQIGDRIYVGGKFLEARANAGSTPVTRPYLAAFDADSGDLITSFAPDVESAVYSLQASPDGSRLFVGGEFRSIDGDNEARALAALDPITGAVDPTWRAKATNTSGARGIVHSLTIDGGQLYLAGRFDQVGGGPRPLHATDKVARVALADGTVDTSLAPDIAGGAVWGVAVAPDSSKIYLAGYHDSVDGDAVGADFAVLNRSDGALLTALSDVGGNSSSLNRRYGQDVVAVGNLVFWAGSEHIVRVFDAATGAVVREHTTDRGGDYQDLEVVGDRVYGSCHCYTNHYADFDWWTRNGPVPPTVAITPIRYVAAYSASTGEHLPSFFLDASATKAGVWAIHGDDDDCLWVGGDLSRITTVAGVDRAAGGFARFCQGDGTDVEAPTAPGNPVQTRAEDAKIVIRWDTSTDNVAVTTYEISRDGTAIGTKTHTGTSQYWYTDTPLQAGTTYTYTIVAIDNAGNRSQPTTLDATTSGTGTDVEAPTAPGNPVQTRAEDAKIVIRWDTSTDNVAVTTYEISRNGTLIGTKTHTGTSQYWYTDTPLQAGTTYTYTIVAIDNAGNRSQPTTLDATTSGTRPGQPPAAPTDLVSTLQTAERIVLNWSASAGAVSYAIERDDGAGFVEVGTSTSRWHTDHDLPAGTTFTYRVIAIGADGSASTPSASVTVATLP